MKFIADFHIHSKYSRAVSPLMDLENLDSWSRIKGIKVLGTGDFTHPKWFEDIKGKLEPADPGLFKLKNLESPTRFILTSEISCIYSKGGKVRKIHIIVFAPSISAVEKINKELGERGNLNADGRPILGLDAKELAKIVLQTDENCLVVPAHCWTPWFSVFGSKSGFNSLEECFDNYTKYIYAIETGLSCYDEKTEVLTSNGWKKFADVLNSDEVCTLNSENNKIEFQKPIKKYSYPYKGKMYRLKTKRVDLLVTPNHRLFVSKCDFRKPPKFFLKEADFLFNRAKRFKKNGIWVGESPKYFTLPGVKMNWGCESYSGGSRYKKEKNFPIKEWLKFFGFWIAEGWTTKGKNNDYNVCLSNTKPKLISEMKQILESFGYNVFYSKQVNTLRVRDYQLYTYLKQFGKCYDKFISQDIKFLSKELLEILLEYYIKGDGHIYGRNGKGLSATTTSVRLRDDLQEIALKIGFSAYYKLDHKKGRPFSSLSQGVIYRQRNDSWVIYFIRRNIHTVLPSTNKKYGHTESWVKFKGKVFCVSVPNQIIYVRRNGIPVWCGNSDPAMNWRLSQLDKITLISNSDAHSLQKIGREANVFDAELSYQSIAEILKTKDKNRFLYTVEFFPEEGKYHYDGHKDCGLSLSPEESKKYNNICPRCAKPLTIGVLNRVEELADRPDGFVPENSVPYKSLIPLNEVIAESIGVSVASKEVVKHYNNLIKNLGSEFKVLLESSRKEIEEQSLPEIAEGIIRMREGKVFVEPGYDGVYGKIKIFSERENPKISEKKNNQKTLF